MTEATRKSPAPLPEPGRLTLYTLLALILIVAGAARLMRAGEGLPYVHNWDEPLVANRALEMMKTGDFNPHFFNYGTVTIYMVLAVDVLHYYRLAGLPVGDPAALRGLGDIKTGDDNSWQWEISHPSFYLWDRRMFAILGAASVALCFLLARRVSGAWAGLLAAAALAGLEYDITYSSMITPNLPVSFLVLLSVVFACLFIQRDEPLFLIGSLVSCGLATAAKYNAALSIVTPVLALSLSAVERRSGHRRWLWAAVAVVPLASFLIAMPYALLDLPKFLNDSAFELRHYSSGQGEATVVPGATHLGWEIREIASSLGLPFALFAAAGLAVWARRRSAWILLAFPVTYLLFMARMRVFIPRNLLAIYPLAAVAFGCGAASIAGWLAGVRPAQRPSPRTRMIVLVLLLAGLCGVGLSSAMTRSWRIATAKESRSVAVDRINAIAGESPTGRMRVGIEAALRLHDEDLKRLIIPYDLLPLRDLVCGHPETHDLIMIAANHSGYSDSATAVAAKEDALLPADREVLAKVGEEHALFLDIYSVDPSIRILGEPSGSGPRPAQCGEKIPFGEMVTSRDYPVTGDGTLALFWNGTVATPTFLAPPGDYEFRWRARGTKAKGRFPSLKATVLEARGAAGAVSATPGTFDLTARFEPCVVRFRMERAGEILLRIDFDDDAYTPASLEDRNVYLEPISLLPIAPEAAPPIPRTSNRSPAPFR